jgi:hypothetical protein
VSIPMEHTQIHADTDQEDLEPRHGVFLLYRATVRALLAEDCMRHALTEGRVG